MHRSIRIYVHTGREVERYAYADRTRTWRGILRWFVETCGFPIVALGCEEGAAVVHLRRA